MLIRSTSVGARLGTGKAFFSHCFVVVSVRHGLIQHRLASKSLFSQVRP